MPPSTRSCWWSTNLRALLDAMEALRDFKAPKYMDRFKLIKAVDMLVSLGRAIRLHLQPMVDEKLSRAILEALAKLDRPTGA
jgi:hypothetical protein